MIAFVKKIVFICALIVASGSTAENFKVFQCYDDMLMTTKLKDAQHPHGSVIATKRWAVQNALVLVDFHKERLLLWQTSKTFDKILEIEQKAHWTFEGILISDDLITAHRRSESEKWRDEFETLTLDLLRPKLVKTVSMENDTYRWTKHYDCKESRWN